MNGMAKLIASLAWILVAITISPFSAAQSGRYQGSSEAREAFNRGQGEAAEGDRYLEEGDTRRAMNAFADAEEHYREALDFDDDFEEAWERLGYVLYVMDRSDDAIEVLEQGLERIQGSLMLRRMLGINLHETGRIDEAVATLEGVDADGGATADTLFILGKHHYEGHDHESAIPYFQRYLVETPDDAGTHGALGNCYLRTDQFELALAAFRTVIELDPTNLTARINMGDVYFASGDFSRAIDIYERVLPSDDSNFRVWFNLAKSHLELEQYEEALRGFSRVTEIRPGVYQGHYFVGVVQTELESFDLARVSLQRSLELEPDHAMSHYRLGVVESRAGHLDAAEQTLRTARELRPEEPWFAWALGDVLRKQERADEAIEQHQFALAQDDQQAEFHESLGRDFFADHRLVPAAESLEHALVLQPDRLPARRALATVLLTRAERAVRSMLLSDAELDLARAAELDVFPLETALAITSVAIANNDLPAATAALESVDPSLRDPLTYRRARAHLNLAQGNPGEITNVLSDLADDEVSSLDPRDAGLLGHAAAHQGEWGRALDLFTHADAGGDEGYQNELGIAHLRVGLTEADRDRWTEANQHFSAAYDLRDAMPDEDATRAEYALGVSELHLGNYDRAVRHLTGAQRSLARTQESRRLRLPDDDDLKIELRLAYALYRRGDHEDAIDILDQLRGGRTQEVAERLLGSAHERLAMRAYDDDDLVLARHHLEIALEFTPRDVALRNNLACLHYGEGSPDRAGRVFGELVEEGSPDIALFNRAVFLDQMENEPEAAYRLYVRYLETGGPAAEQARRFADSKAEVFGYE